MLPENLHDFLIASVGASASFIGLLFVALTLVLGRIPMGSSPAARERALAGSSYTALITIFILSLIGLIPSMDVAWFMVALGWLGIGSSLQTFRAQRTAIVRRDSASTISSLVLVYVALLCFGIYSAVVDNNHLNTNGFIAVLLVLYVTALGRAWSLIGIEERSESRRETDTK
jgi:hypothetical protein